MDEFPEESADTPGSNIKYEKEVEEISECHQKIGSMLCKINERNMKERSKERELCEYPTKNVNTRLPKISLKNYGNSNEFILFKAQFFLPSWGRQ